MAAKSNGKSDPQLAPKRSRVSQSDVPAYSLKEALRVIDAIAQHGFVPTRPLDVAAAMQLTPTSSFFKMLTGAALAYGLTSSGYGSATISATPLGQTIAEPKEEGEDLIAKRQAVLKPRVVKEFLARYDGRQLPRDEKISLAVLADMQVPRDNTKRALDMIIENAKFVGFLQEIKGSLYINLAGTSVKDPAEKPGAANSDPPAAAPVDLGVPKATLQVGDNPRGREVNRRVFITHGKNRAFIDPLKDLLIFGELEPVVSVERESVSQPVPDKVMADMRSCSAAIIHVEGELSLIDPDGNKHAVLNPNVLIEIGAAMALFGRRFILLVRDGSKLPSNLQGLYEVRYIGDKLDGEATIRLLKAIKDIKNHPLPAADTKPDIKI